MENCNEINQKIAKNLIHYRKAAGLTQAEVAEKINYSDKSVSKWESGNGVPDVYTLVQLADLYGITLNEFVGEEAKALPTGQPSQTKKSHWLHILIMLLSAGIVWLVAIFSFALCTIINPNGAWWLIYLYAVLIAAIVTLVYAAIWKYRIVNFLSVSTIIWMALACLYLTIRVLVGNFPALWCIFLIGAPLQVLEILWAFFRTLRRKQKKMTENISAQTELEEKED